MDERLPYPYCRALIGWVTTHQDITEREELNARVAEQHEQLEAMLENMLQGVAMFDAEQKLVVCNRRLFEQEMNTQMRARRALESELRRALSAQEFELHYQRVVDLATNDISGFEALIR
jgi:sensor c-di-GMP phosphodiesterase-like protein